MKYFDIVKSYLVDLEYTIVKEDAEDEIFIIEREEEGITNMIIACADPILIIEQHLLKIKKESIDIYKNILQKNRDIIHGALVLDEKGENLIFRDTLQLENLDANELEASIESLSLLLTEYSNELIRFGS